MCNMSWETAAAKRNWEKESDYQESDQFPRSRKKKHRAREVGPNAHRRCSMRRTGPHGLNRGATVGDHTTVFYV